jgi:hypothetical protein
VDKKKTILIALAVLFPIILGVGAALMLDILSNSQQKRQVQSSPAETLVAPSSPSPQITGDPAKAPDPSVDNSLQDFTKQFPIVPKLPHATAYWVVQIGGEIADGKVPLQATVYVKPGQNKDELIGKQRPYIENWIKEAGQAPDTYTLTVTAEAPDTY